MSALLVEIPESLERDLEQLSQTDGVSIDQLLIRLAQERIEAIQGSKWLRTEVQKGSRDAFERVMAAVPEGDVLETDKILTDL